MLTEESKDIEECATDHSLLTNGPPSKRRESFLESAELQWISGKAESQPEFSQIVFGY